MSLTYLVCATVFQQVNAQRCEKGGQSITLFADILIIWDWVLKLLLLKFKQMFLGSVIWLCTQSSGIIQDSNYTVELI